MTSLDHDAAALTDECDEQRQLLTTY